MKTALTLPARSALVQLTPEIPPVVSVSTLHPATEPVQCLDIFIESDLIRARPFEHFGTVRRDAADNKALLANSGKITMPVFAIGAGSFSARIWLIRCGWSPATSRAAPRPTPDLGSWSRTHRPPSSWSQISSPGRPEQSKGKRNKDY